MRDKYSFSLRQLDAATSRPRSKTWTREGGRGLKFPEMGHLPEDEGRERREKREWTEKKGRRSLF